MKKLTLLTAVFILHSPAFSQVGIGTPNPDPSALLELNVNSENDKKGFLPPRMTAAERNEIPSPAEGLVVYNTTENCLNFYNGTGWVSICDGSVTIPPDPLNSPPEGSNNSQMVYSSIQQTTDGSYIVANTSPGG